MFITAVLRLLVNREKYVKNCEIKNVFVIIQNRKNWKKTHFRLKIALFIFTSFYLDLTRNLSVSKCSRSSGGDSTLSAARGSACSLETKKGYV